MLMKEVVLYDIFPEVEISTHLPIEGIALLAIMMFLLFVFFYQARKRKTIEAKERQSLDILKNLDWDDARTAANRLEYYAPLHIENGSQKDALKKISKSLSLQKYHPNPPALTQNQTIMIARFIESLG